MKKLKTILDKHNLRRKIGLIASYTEMLVAFAIIIGILLLCLQVFTMLKQIAAAVITGSSVPSFPAFLSVAFELVIGIEFVKMLAKHTPGSAIEVLLYTIARALIVDHSSMQGALFGVISIAILFAVQKFFNEPDIHNHETGGDYIVNGGISMREVNKRLDADFDEAAGHTVAGYLYNYLHKTGKPLEPGYKVQIGDYIFEIYDMEGDLIRYIKITPVQ